MLALRGLPGIRIDVAPPPPAEVLPRMDVAVFVGFAATGPMHHPVVIESVAQYAAVFGPDAPLAWDEQRGERLYANLGPAVRAFFSNGGRRCWVIRVAWTQALEAIQRDLGRFHAPRSPATSNRFSLPGILLAPGNGTPLAPAFAQARSVGSWSDPLRVATALSSSGIAIDDYAPLPSTTAGSRVTFRTRAPLQTGDLVRFDGSSGTLGAAVESFAIIDRIVTTGDDNPWALRVEATICAAFEELGGPTTSPPTLADGSAEIPGVTSIPLAATLAIDPEGNGSSVHFTAPVAATLAEGQWVRWSDGGLTVWLRVDALGGRAAGPDHTLADAVVTGRAWRERPTPMAPAYAPDRATIVTVDLLVSRGRSDAFRLTGLGLTPLHHSSWWQRASDDVYYASHSGELAAGRSATADLPRDFPLAAPDDELQQPRPRALVPLGVTAAFAAAPGPLPQAASALERDGLATFDADLFLDPELERLGVGTLMAEAEAIRFLRSAPRGLFGLHAGLSVGAGGLYNEASLIAVPDALHVGWTKRAPLDPPSATPKRNPPPAHWFTHRGPCAEPPPDDTADKPDFSRFLDCGTREFAPPHLSGPARAIPRGTFQLAWITSPPESAAVYAVEEAERADFADAREVSRGAVPYCDINARREGIFYYRVRALLGDERSPDSNAVTVVVRDDAWVAVATADFAMTGEGELLRVHRALLRMAAASGELFAVLGVPRHYQAADAIRYAARLRAGRSGSGAVEPEGFDFAERSALSYAALYHPWLVSGAAPPIGPGAAGATRANRASRPGTTTPVSGQTAVPPDGPTLGVLAARASRRGAWVAPANEPFKDIVALTPPIELAAWLPLQDAQVNLIRSDVRGFVALGASTLAHEVERRPINVRRLLILLRRLALRRGTTYLFEPNDDTLRRAVERGFTVLLNDMFRRGAFAGATAAESFKVVTDDGINAAADRDAGRLLAELRVAPALPLQFLTIRLAQTGERLTVVEEL